MIELLKLARQEGYERLEQVVNRALSLECWDASAIRYLLVNDSVKAKQAEPVEVGVLSRYERPMPEVVHYDQLLAWEGRA
jgi:hypothetical protein